MTAGPRARLAAGLLLAALLLLSATAIWAASVLADFRGAAAVHAAGGRVYLGAGHRVLVTDDTGRFLGALERSPGKPCELGAVASVSSGPDGGVYVADGVRHQVLAFDGERQLRAVVSPRPAPEGLFEVTAAPGGLLLADTMGHRLRLVDEEGRTRRSIAVGYPNGLTRYRDDGGEYFVLAETGRARPVAFGLDLASAEPPAVRRLSAWLGSQEGAPGWLRRPQLLDLTSPTDGELLAAACRTPLAECELVRVGAGPAAVVGHLGFLVPEHPDAVDDLMLTGELAATSRGEVLAASPRLDDVFVFQGPDGPPAPGFCLSCSDEELGRVRQQSADFREATFSNGTVVRRFGDQTVQDTFRGLRRERGFYVGAEAVGRGGTLAAGVLLLVALFFARQTGALSPARARAHLAALVERLLRPNARAWALLAGSGALAGAGGAGAGALALGVGGAVSLGLAGAFLGLRWLGVPAFLRTVTAGAAAEAWRLQLGESAATPVALEQGEVLAWVTFGKVEVRRAKEAVAAREVAQVDGLLDALEALVPPLLLVACTDRRLFVVRCSALGAPLDDVASYPLGVEAPAEAPRALTLETGARVVTSARSGGVVTLAAAPQWLCAQCRGPLRQCRHGADHGFAASLLTLIGPGLGHLVQSRYGRARSLLLAGVALASQFFREFLPRAMGALPPDTASWLPALGAWGVAVVAAFIDVAGYERRRQRRAGATR